MYHRVPFPSSLLSHDTSSCIHYPIFPHHIPHYFIIHNLTIPRNHHPSYRPEPRTLVLTIIGTPSSLLSPFPTDKYLPTLSRCTSSPHRSATASHGMRFVWGSGLSAVPAAFLRTVLLLSPSVDVHLAEAVVQPVDAVAHLADAVAPLDARLRSRNPAGSKQSQPWPLLCRLANALAHGKSARLTDSGRGGCLSSLEAISSTGVPPPRGTLYTETPRWNFPRFDCASLLPICTRIMFVRRYGIPPSECIANVLTPPRPVVPVWHLL